MSREFPTATVRLGDAGADETAVKLTVFAPETDANLALRLHPASGPKREGYPINVRMTKRDALHLATKLIEAAAADSALGTGPRRPGSKTQT